MFEITKCRNPGDFRHFVVFFSFIKMRPETFFFVLKLMVGITKCRTRGGGLTHPSHHADSTNLDDNIRHFVPFFDQQSLNNDYLPSIVNIFVVINEGCVHWGASIFTLTPRPSTGIRP